MYGVDISRDSWVLALAAHIYYHGTSEEQQSPLSDAEYDALKNIILIQWAEVPEELKEIFISREDLSITGMHVKLTKEQIAKANRYINP